MTQEGPKSDGNYRINPDFVRPEPTAANLFSFVSLDDFSPEKHRETCDLMVRNGAKQIRLTLVNDEHPNPPYPNGYWYEGWDDAAAVQLPFGAAREDGTISPPLTLEQVA